MSKKIVEVKYEIVAIFENGELKWELETLDEATQKYGEVKNFKRLKKLECNEIVKTKVNLF